MVKKDYTALLSNKVWPEVQNKLLAGIQNGQTRDAMKTVLANTRQALLAD